MTFPQMQALSAALMIGAFVGFVMIGGVLLYRRVSGKFLTEIELKRILTQLAECFARQPR